MSFRSQYGRRHPYWLEGLVEIFFGNEWGLKMDERVVDSAILLNQSSCISFGTSNKSRNVLYQFEGFDVDRV